MDEDIVLQMRIATNKMPPADVVCKREDNHVFCEITDVATHRKIAHFTVSKDLQSQIPEILSLYMNR
ncbi:MAG: hypothetical protein GXO43_01625 [Crenarchaeota archaeon]|nr:hypothetical protein [Thermoproteota archaeon]